MYLTCLGLALTTAISVSAADRSPRDESPLPVCEKPGWFCPSPGTTAFCNKHNRYVDGSVCPVGTCCSITVNGTAACTEEACSAYAPESHLIHLQPRRKDWGEKNYGSRKKPGGEDDLGIGRGQEKYDDPNLDPLSELPLQCDKNGWFCSSDISIGFCDNLGQITNTRMCDRSQCCELVSDGNPRCSTKACRYKGRRELAPEPSKVSNDHEKKAQELDYCQLQKHSGWSCPHERVAVFCNDDHEEEDGFGCDAGWCCTLSQYGKASCTQDACYLPPITDRSLHPTQLPAAQLEEMGPGESYRRSKPSSASPKPKTASSAAPTPRGPVDAGSSPMFSSTNTTAHLIPRSNANYNGTASVSGTTAVGNATRPLDKSSYPPFFQHDADDDCIIGQVRCYHHDHASPPERREDAKSHVEVCNGSHKWMAIEVCEEPEKRCEMVAENNAKCVEVHW